MPPEHHPTGVQLTHIHIDLSERSLTFRAGETAVAKLTLAQDGLIFTAAPTTELPQQTEGDARSHDDGSPPGTPYAGETREKEQTVTRSGKLVSTPKPGKPDRRGAETAWARFAAHVEGEEQAHLYSTTFHRHTATIALSLERNVPITVEGYVHESTEPDKRMDSLSVIRFHAYPGKPEK